MSGFHPTRGERIDIGGRCLRAVLAGPDTGPLVVLESGAFGCAADWAEVQKQLAAKGLRSLAYDRAGLGFSDPGPRPRDSQAIAHDLGLLLDRMGLEGPLILVGHSMAGLMVRLHARGLGDRVRGLVLVDATTPESWDVPTVRRVVGGFGRLMGLVGRTAPLGYMRPLAWMIGDNIGLDGEAGMVNEISILAVDRHEELGTHQLEHRAKLFLAGVAGNMGARILRVVNLAALTVELVDDRAEFVDPHTLKLTKSGKTVTAAKILIATGGWPSMPKP